jgi:hypothetical protein
MHTGRNNRAVRERDAGGCHNDTSLATARVNCSVFALTVLGPREAEMRIIGSDLHARQQTVAMLDTITGEVVNMTLTHEGNNVREFYSTLPRPARVGIEASGSMQWFLNLMEELGIECRVAGGRPLSGDLAAFKGTTRSTGLVAAPSSVGTDADPNTKCAAVYGLGEWFATTNLVVESGRTKQDRSVAVGAPYRISAE